MATMIKNTAVNKNSNKGSNAASIKSHANDAVVLKKVEEASKTLQRVGLPVQK
ncbi:hypothetical protein [Mucilaginibacter pedocola]|uniref:hypothetical protein n=1 Tax=Mucilaginibacter pedocola TaxID=1792845 RepID=UPI0012DF25CD|nr:hypothetical protein [Mucilaginibacter pedocola]